MPVRNIDHDCVQPRRLDNLEQEIRQIRHTVASDQEVSPVSSAAQAEPSAEKASTRGEDLPNAETLWSNLLQEGILCSNQVLEKVDISPPVFCDLFLAYCSWTRRAIQHFRTDLVAQVLS